MKDIEKAKQLLETTEATCVLVLEDKLYTSNKSGIAPMMHFLAQKTDLTGFSAADKIIGKAAAMLFALAGVAEVYAEVMSRSAIPVLDKYKIRYSFGTLTDKIINRTGDGICPMEQTVMNQDDPTKAYKMLADKLRCLQAEAASPKQVDGHKLE